MRYGRGCSASSCCAATGMITSDTAVMDCIDFRIGDAYDHDLEIVSGLPPPLQMVFSTWRLDAEVGNGGFHQYFYNQGRFAFMAAEGCRLISADAHLNLLLQAIDVYLNEEPTQGLFRPSEVKEMLGLYVLARKSWTCPRLIVSTTRCPPSTISARNTCKGIQTSS